MKKEDIDIRVTNGKDPKDMAGYAENPVCVYYGSKKDELEDVCTDCLQISNCVHFQEIEEMRKAMREASKNPNSFTNLGLPDGYLEKVKDYIMMIIKCEYKIDGIKEETLYV